jgi:hypothetical protein
LARRAGTIWAVKMTERNWDNFFTAEDFRDEKNRKSVEMLGAMFGFDPVPELEKMCAVVAKKANAILRAELERAPVVYAEPGHPSPGRNCWTDEKAGSDTHSARLVGVREITSKDK